VEASLRIHEAEIYYFLSGAGLSWLATYLTLTHKRRTVANVKRKIDLLSLFHQNLTPKQHRQLEEAASDDKECWRFYLWAREVLQPNDKLYPYRNKISPTMLAAEAILCVKVLGLTSLHAQAVLARAVKRTNPNLGDFEEILEEVIADFGDQFSPPTHARTGSRS
jgi:hypothetical protein